jgi:hypothetical protein
MSQLVALAVSIGLLGGVATALYLKFGLLIWAGFIAWACFFHSGGNEAGLQNTIVGNAFGAVCAWVAALILASGVAAGLGAAGAPVVVGVTVLAMVLGAHLKPFSAVPNSVYGYAATFAYLLQTPDTLAQDKLMSVGFGNALILVIVSMALGALFGYASGKLAGALKK